MNTFGTLEQLRCGCTNGIRLGHWTICPQHDYPDMVEYAKERKVGHFVYNFTPDRRGARPSPEELQGLA